MPIISEEDYDKLKQCGIDFEEDEQQRFFVFKNYALPTDVYQVASCDILVVIPPNYNQAGNDMFWTLPRLNRADGKGIPQTSNLGDGDNRKYRDQEFCRWSRHWQKEGNAWRAGRDDIISIQRRIEWALNHPDAQ